MITAHEGVLKGRTIVKVRLNTYTDSDGRRHHDPVFYLDNGARVFFNVTERADGADYGVTPYYIPKKEIKA